MINTQEKFKQTSIIVLLLGAVLALALAPFNIFPIFFISLWGLLKAIETSKSGYRAFFISYIWGMGYSITSLYWFSNALLVDSIFYLLIPLVIIATMLIGGIFYAIWGLAIYYSPKKYRLILIPVLGTIIEIIKGFIFTGFPWNNIATMLVKFPILIQTAYIFGEHGVSFLFLFFSTLLIYVLRRQINKKLAIVCALPLIFILSYGYYRQANHPTTYWEGVSLRLVQPNISQYDIFFNKNLNARLDTVMKLATTDANNSHPTQIILPEAIIPYTLRNYDIQNLPTEITKYIPANTYLIAGAIRSYGYKQYNSVVFIKNNKVLGIYDKRHLVPFGEYIPLSNLFPSINPLVGFYNFSSGETANVIDSDDLPPVIPSVCYEVIFSNLYKANKKYNWILVVSNQAWFGYSTSAYQMMASAQFRAVERGVPVVLVGNNGATAVIDPLGNIVKILPLNKAGVLDSKLPKAL